MNKAFHVISGVTNIPDSLHLPIPLSIDRFAPAFFATYHPVHFGFVYLVPQQYLLYLSLPRSTRYQAHHQLSLTEMRSVEAVGYILAEIPRFVRLYYQSRSFYRSSTDNRVMCFTVCICRRVDSMQGLYVETALRFNCTGFLLSIILILQEGWPLLGLKSYHP